jgi:hypothetical protein
LTNGFPMKGLAMKGSVAPKSKRNYKMLRQGTRCLGDFSVRDFRRAVDAADQAASHIWKLEAALKCRSCNKLIMSFENMLDKRLARSPITDYGICLAARSANAHLAQCRRVILFENGTHSLAVNVCSLVNDQ